MPKSPTGRALLDRRSAILAGTASSVPRPYPMPLRVRPRPGSRRPPISSLPCASSWRASSPTSARPPSFAWNGPEWSAWNYFGVGGYIKPGLRLEQMSAEQKAAAWDLLATLLSPGGIAKARNVMTAAGRAGGQRQRHRPALLGAVLVLRLRHARRDGRVGLPPRRAPPHPVDRRARQPDRVGHAVLVLGLAQPHHQPERMPAW